MKPDWTKQTVYKANIYNEEKIIYQCYFNEKAWNKTIENNILWEYEPNNGRVLEHSLLESGELDMNNASYDGDVIKINLVQHHSADKSNIDNKEVLYVLQKIIEQRRAEIPENSYTTHLFEKGEEKIKKKMGEEAIEVILAQSNKDIVYESADLIYHLMVYLVYKGISIDDVLSELKSR